MAYFPFFIELKNKKCYIFGGGTVAYRKILALLEFEADITVIAPEVCNDILVLEDKIHIIPRRFNENDLEDAFFVIAATNDEAVNQVISQECKERKILVNVVDVLEECTFLFPAYVKKGDISIGVTTAGKSPVMAGYIKKMIQDMLPDFYEALVSTLGSFREFIKLKVNSSSVRSVILKELAGLGIRNRGKITQEDVDSLIQKYNNDDNNKLENFHE